MWLRRTQMCWACWETKPLRGFSFFTLLLWINQESCTTTTKHQRLFVCSKSLYNDIYIYICFVINLRVGCLCLLAQRLKAGVTVGVWCFQWHHTPTQLQRCTISLLTTMLIKADIVIILLYRPDAGAGAADGRLWPGSQIMLFSFLPSLLLSCIIIIRRPKD